MAQRNCLPNRRGAMTFSVECNGLQYTCTASFFESGDLGEIFLINHRVNSHADSCARDAAILASLALQHGVPLDVLRKSLLRDPRGLASTPIGVALDTLAKYPDMSGKAVVAGDSQCQT
jgi:hypothetical protein